MLGVDDGQNAGDRLAQIVAKIPSVWRSFKVSLVVLCRLSYIPVPSDGLDFRLDRGLESVGSHLVQLAARRSDLLDAQLAELSLELAELLHQIILALVPKLDSLNLGRRLEEQSAFQRSCRVTQNEILLRRRKENELAVW